MRNKVLLILLSALAVLPILAARGAQVGGDSGKLEFTDVEKQTREFHRYNEEITLTLEQEEVYRQALSELPAPCCSNNTALTCCCPCNMAKSWWGLAKHLIADRGYGVEEVKATVQGWFEFINPDGFSGNVCYTGGCNRAFKDNGCGGMAESHLVF